MFQFTRFASASYVFRYGYPCGWVSPFRNPGINAYLPAPPGLSQAITSFFAYHRQGIHHMLLVTWPYNFDVFRKTPKPIKDCCQVSHLTRYAVMWMILQISLSWERFVITRIEQSSYSFWRNQNFVIKGTVALACISPDNADFDSMNC